MSHLELSDGSTILAKIAQEFTPCLGVLRIAHLSEFVFQLLFLAFEVHAPFVVIAVFSAGDNFGYHGLDLGLDATGENAVQRVIIARWDGVELMIVTPGAGNGEAKETFGHDVNA